MSRTITQTISQLATIPEGRAYKVKLRRKPGDGDDDDDENPSSSQSSSHRDVSEPMECDKIARVLASFKVTSTLAMHQALENGRKGKWLYTLLGVQFPNTITETIDALFDAAEAEIVKSHLTQEGRTLKLKWTTKSHDKAPTKNNIVYIVRCQNNVVKLASGADLLEQKALHAQMWLTFTKLVDAKKHAVQKLQKAKYANLINRASSELDAIATKLEAFEHRTNFNFDRKMREVDRLVTVLSSIQHKGQKEFKVAMDEACAFVDKAPELHKAIYEYGAKVLNLNVEKGKRGLTWEEICDFHAHTRN